MEFYEPFHFLANAIIIQSVKDFRHYNRILKSNPWDRETKQSIKDIEHFFLSPWFDLLSGINGAKLLEALRAETKCQPKAHRYKKAKALKEGLS